MTAAPVGLAREREIFSRSAKSLRWKVLDHVFEIISPNPHAIEMARRVFTAAGADINAQPVLSWAVDSDGKVSTDEELAAKLSQIEADALMHVFQNVADLLTVHSALVARGGKGVVIVGPSLAGKSTLAAGLWRNGWSLLADDACFLDPRTASATPAPRRVSLRFASRSLIGDELWNKIRESPSCREIEKGLCFHPHDVRGQERLDSVPLSAIFFLARLDVSLGPAQLARMHAAKASLALLPYAFNARVLPFIEGLGRVSPICERVPAFDLGRGTLNEMITAVESTVG